MADESLTGVELALYEHFRYLGCPSVVDPVDTEDCAGMAVEVVRFMRAAGWVPLAEVLDALRDEEAFPSWRRALTGPRPEYPSSTVRHHLADYLAEWFPTVPQGADERNGHG